jgi:hypothetical protein
MARQRWYLQVTPTVIPCGVGRVILAMRIASLTGDWWYYLVRVGRSDGAGLLPEY